MSGGGSGRQPGSSFKPFVLAQALQAGITPDTTYSGRDARRVRRVPLPRHGARELRGRGLWHARPAHRHVKSVNTVYTRLILDVGVDKTMALAKTMGLTSVPTTTPPCTARASPSAPSRCRPSTWPPPTACSRRRASAPSPPRCCASPTGTGNVLIDSSEPATARVLGRGRGRQRHRHPPGRARQRHGRRPRPRPAGRRQDRHHAEQPRCVVRRLHADAVHRGVDRLREQDRGDHEGARTASRACGEVTGGTHPARLWQAFMRAALTDVPITEFSEPAADPGRARRAPRSWPGAASQPGKRKYPSGDPPAAPTSRTPARPRPTCPRRRRPCRAPRRRRPIPTTRRPPPRAACSTEPRGAQPGCVSGSGQRMTSAHEVRIGTPKNTASGENPRGA